MAGGRRHRRRSTSASSRPRVGMRIAIAAAIGCRTPRAPSWSMLAAPVLQNVGGAARAAGSPAARRRGHRRRQHQAGDPRSGARAAGAAAVRRRPSARGRGGRRRGGGAAGSVRRPAVAADAEARPRRARAGLADGVRVRSPRRSAASSRPTEHDRLLAFLSHLPQLAVTALMHVVGDTRARRRAGAGGARPSRHHPAGIEPGVAVAGHRRHQRRQHRTPRSTS